MQPNVGSADRVVRLVLAAAAFVLAFTTVGPTSIAGIVLIVVGAVLALTAVIRFCPLYRVLGLNSCRTGA